MKTRNTEALVALMAVRRQLGNVDLYNSMLFDYTAAMENIELAIEIAKMNVMSDLSKGKR